jgi:hypothetical protein
MQGKRFRVDRYRVDQSRRVVAPSVAPDVDASADAIQRHHELILEIRALRSAIAAHDNDPQRIIDTYQAHISEIQKLKQELDIIQAAM